MTFSNASFLAKMNLMFILFWFIKYTFRYTSTPAHDCNMVNKNYLMWHTDTSFNDNISQNNSSVNQLQEPFDNEKNNTSDIASYKLHRESMEKDTLYVKYLNF